MYVKEKSAVPLSQFRQGSIVEFNVGPSALRPRTIRGTVKHLIINGPRSVVAELTNASEDGKELPEINEHTLCAPACNISHAVKVLQHSNGPLVFNQSEPFLDKDVQQALTNGVLQRRGHRLVCVDGGELACAILDHFVSNYVSRNRQALGIHPWEIVDYEEIRNAVHAQGITRVDYKTLNDESYPWPVYGHIDTRRLHKFIKANINRFKCNTRKVEKQREEEDYRQYLRELEQERERDTRGW